MITSKKLLITGINGRIGRILHDPLSASYSITGCDLTGPFSHRVFQLDIREEKKVEAFFDRHGPFPLIVHLAADPRVEAPWTEVLAHNIKGTRNLYHAARLNGTQRIVFASSNHVTGAYEGFPPHLHLKQDPEKISREDPLRPDSYYGVSKAFGEALARYYHERWGLSSICLRIGSVLKDDDPAGNPRHLRTWLSHRDLVQLVLKSLQAEVDFGVYYGVSDNEGRFWSLKHAREELGYQPQDSAGKSG